MIGGKNSPIAGICVVLSDFRLFNNVFSKGNMALNQACAHSGFTRFASRLTVTLAVLASCLIQAPAMAQTVAFAGFSYAGNFSTAAARFPHTFKIDAALKAGGDASARLSRVVIERAYAAGNPTLQFAPRETLMSTKSSDQTLMAVLLMTGETVSTEHFGSYYKTFVSLRGDALIFDYKAKTVVRSYPISVVVFDASEQEPDEAMLDGYVKNLLLRDDNGGLFTQFAKRMSAASLPAPGTKTIQVKRAQVTPEAMALMPAAMRGNPELVGQMLSDAFGSILSAKLGVPLLPTALGHALNAMSFRLDNGDALDLKIGEGDYLFEIGLNKFAKIKSGENNVGASYVYGAYGNIRFFEPSLNTDFVHSDFKNGEVKVVPAGQVSVDDFPAYESAIRGMYLKFADALATGDTKWISTASAAKDISKQFEATRDIIKACK